MLRAQHDLASDPPPQLRVALRCPRCKGDLAGFTCSSCAFNLRIVEGIIRALPPERAERYTQFTKEYERIRAAEGRGSEHADFYLALPYKDMSGRNDGQWRVRARSFDYLLQRILKPVGHGRVLDLGAGNGWMSFRLALAGYEPVAVDLLANNRDGLAAAAHYEDYLPEPFLRFQAEMTRLPFQDEQFEIVIFNASFHYSEDYEATLREALRCLRSNGMVVISDTPWYSRADSGRQMVCERKASFLKRYGTSSDSIQSLEYLTDESLQSLAEKVAINWTIYSPWYGFRWALRPWIAKLRGKREPSQFRIYVAIKHE